MKKSVKIWIIILVIVLGVADLMALHNIYATDSPLYIEYIVLGFSLAVFLLLAFRLVSKR